MGPKALKNQWCELIFFSFRYDTLVGVFDFECRGDRDSGGTLVDVALPILVFATPFW